MATSLSCADAWAKTAPGRQRWRPSLTTPGAARRTFIASAIARTVARNPLAGGFHPRIPPGSMQTSGGWFPAANASSAPSPTGGSSGRGSHEGGHGLT